MQKIIAVLLVSFFTVSAFEIYVKPSAHKSCCCPSASMCRCKHNGNQCPLKTHAESNPSKKHEGTVLVKLQGCGSGNSPVISPQFYKDLFFASNPRQFFKLSSDFLIESNSQLYSFLPVIFLDKPPKIISLR